MADDMQFIVDLASFNRGLRILDRELQKETRRRMAAIARKGRDEARGAWPFGPAKGGHSRVTITSGTQGLVPYIGWQRRNPRYPYAPWLEFGGKRPRDRVVRPRVSGGRYFYPAVGRARKAAGDEVYDALQDAKRRAGLR